MDALCSPIAYMDLQLVGTLTYADFRAEVYSTNLPGEFRLVYRDAAGLVVEEGVLTGISSYKQRETEILHRLRELQEGTPAAKTARAGDVGEY